MQVATIVCRTLLGLIFVVFGLNYWFRVIPVPPPEGAAAAFLGAMKASGYLSVVKVLEVAGGLLVWTGRWTALGLVILTPIVVNIVCYDILLAGGLNPIVIAAAAFNLFLLYSERGKFLPLL